MSKFIRLLALTFTLILSTQLQSQNIRDYAQFFSVEAATKAQNQIESLEKK